MKRQRKKEIHRGVEKGAEDREEKYFKLLITNNKCQSSI
jgi:hypothetical protein